MRTGIDRDPPPELAVIALVNDPHGPRGLAKFIPLKLGKFNRQGTAPSPTPVPPAARASGSAQNQKFRDRPRLDACPRVIGSQIGRAHV